MYICVCVSLGDWYVEPSLLLQHPSTSSLDLANVSNFAFPAGILLSPLDPAESGSGVNTIMFGTGE